MDILAFVAGVVLLVMYKRSAGKNKPLLFLGIALVIVGLIPFTFGFVRGFQKGFEQARHPQSVADSMSEEETKNMMISISKCWGLTEKESNLPVVQINVHLNPDTSIQTIHVVDAERDRYNNDAVFRETADRAMNTLKVCPLTFLPKEKYKIWEDMELTFDPKPEP